MLRAPMLASTSRWLTSQLAASKRAQDYFSKRGIDAATRKRFSLGYAPEGFDGLKNALGTHPEALRLLEQTGMLAKSDGGHLYDRFRERVMFPIHDRRGRPIAFGGRVIGKTTADGKEAICFALMAHDSLAGYPTNIPGATGAQRAVSLGKVTNL